MRRAVLGLAAALLAAPSVASAMPPAKMLATSRAVAGCMELRHSDMVSLYLERSLARADAPFSEAMKDALRGCMIEANARDAKAMRIDDDTMRALFAEAWLLDAENGIGDPVLNPRPNYAARWVSAVPEQSVVDRMALCLVASHPGEAAALVRATPGSPAEASAMAALKPHFGGCLVKDAKLTTNADGVRLSVAKALYYRDHGAMTVMAGKN